MAPSSSNLQDGSIRKIRSTGDIPRVPDRAHLPSIQISDASAPNSTHDATLSSNNADSEAGAIRSESSRRSLPSSANLNELSSARLRSSVAMSLPPVAQQQPSTPAAGAVSTLQVPLPAPNVLQRPINAANTQRNMPLFRRMLLFCAIGRNASPTRRAKRALVLNTFGYWVQFITIITLLVLCGTHYKSPTSPLLSEWKACDRPLGAWASIWLGRLILVQIIGFLEFQRTLVSLAHPNSDLEGNGADGRPVPHAASQNHADANAPHRPVHINDSSNTIIASQNPPLPHSTLYSRLTMLSSLITLSWFLTAHILEYSSINTCRHSSPHLWWLVFGILCFLYIMILEVVLLGVIVLIIAPILFILWNIFLVCLGRHPMQNPNMIKPEIKGIPKSVVERIPLVIYIPPPPHDEQEKVSDTSMPHIYPPKSLSLPKPQQKRFKLLRSFSSLKSTKADEAVDEKETRELSNDDDQGPIAWEDNWEKTDYPFVALEGNRAACAICLLDFEEPKRKHINSDCEALVTQTAEPSTTNTNLPSSSNSPAGSPTATTTHGATIAEEQREPKLKLEDAGEGPQPLRLLACGHVFHKTCLDPWLIDVSGRCPICQRKVEVPPAPKKSRRGS
ncbi:hypothetical protein BDN70DRAFT_938931 [Pholiota conissans]|uniref:RING-type domain-containing protein n=1 Tax=Pholiota conissans TaxID=109636 RepID=A0A9P5YPS2_9AGAR|nr:hypothetical protein BDN70DRAFT_938931 [Pholiota conissans]